MHTATSALDGEDYIEPQTTNKGIKTGEVCHSVGKEFDVSGVDTERVPREQRLMHRPEHTPTHYHTSRLSVHYHDRRDTRVHPSTSSDYPEFNPARRKLLKYLMSFSIIATLGGVLTPIIGYLWPTKRQVTHEGGQVRVASLAELQATRGIVASANDQPIVLTYDERGGVRAFSGICTHLGCVVQWESNGGYIQCPCHEARFNPSTGDVISGPAPSALPSYPVEVDDDDIYVST